MTKGINEIQKETRGKRTIYTIDVSHNPDEVAKIIKKIKEGMKHD